MRVKIQAIILKDILKIIRGNLGSEIEKIAECNHYAENHNNRMLAQTEESAHKQEDRLVNEYCERLKDETRTLFFRRVAKYTGSEIYKLGETYRSSSAAVRARAVTISKGRLKMLTLKSFPDSDFIQRLECAVEIGTEVSLSGTEINALIEYCGGYKMFQDLLCR